MRYAIKLGKLIRGSKGQATISAAMILLLIGGILIPPCLGFAVVSLKASQSGEQVLKGRYAADSGVEDAVWRISDGNLSMPVYSYSLVEEVNDRNVSVTIREIVGGVYKIISTATSDTGGNATIECYVLNIPSFLGLLDSAITSNGTVTIKHGANVTGNITANGTVDNKGDVNGTVTEGATINFPSELQLSTWYSHDVNKLASYPSDRIDIATDPIVGPLYRNGTLDIYNGGSVGKNAMLNGTVYVTNDPSIRYDLEIGKTTGTSNDFTLNLNNQTIFCEGGIEVTDVCNITGSGCIIAVGDVKFAPKGDVGGPGDFVFIMSVEGTVELYPSGSFYGAIVGNVTIELKSGHEGTITWIDPGEGSNFNFPTESEGETMVLSYTIK
ncbi:hypothetical protein ES706_02271 [subsurface metagenome]